MELQSQYANRLLLDGYEQESCDLLEEILEQAIRLQSHLIIIAQGTILTSLWMKRGKFLEAASLVSIEESAKVRHNWIALACGSMIRATCWRTQGMIPQAIAVLMETGNFLYEKGAIAALNLIRARLTEFPCSNGRRLEYFDLDSCSVSTSQVNTYIFHVNLKIFYTKRHNRKPRSDKQLFGRAKSLSQTIADNDVSHQPPPRKVLFG